MDIEKRVGFGFFEVPDHNFFTVDHTRAPHVTESETQIMITQMMYPFMAEILNSDGIEGLRLSYDQFYKIAKDGVFLIEELKKRDIFQVLRQSILGGVPFLGICLGHQLLFEKSEEAPGVKGLGVFKGSVVKFKSKGIYTYRRIGTSC